MLLAIGGLCSNALAQESKNESALANETLEVSENVSKTNTSLEFPDFNLVKFAQPSPAVIKVPINILNNTTKEVWTSPGNRPAFVFAGITNNGKLKLDVYTISMNPETKARETPQLAGTALPNGDGIIVYGEFIAIAIKCEDSTTTQYCTGTLETDNLFN